jgi:hypothetical protein
MNANRRSFVLQAFGTVALAALGRSATAASSMLSESDASARVLGYVADASHADRAKYPRYQVGQRCGNCRFYQGKPSGTSAQCALFGAKQVSGGGWCNAYQARV